MPEKSQDVLVAECLHSLGVSFLTEWDALTFVYKHGAILCTAAQIARLIGCDMAETGAALQKLERLGLIQRSRAAQWIRFYRFSPPPEPTRHSCFLELMRLTQDRAGRVLLLKHLKRHRLEPRRKRDSGLRLA